MALTQITGSGIGQVTDIKLGGSGSANTLNDYEEGTFTPTLVSSGGDSLSIGTASGNYTKIGNVVYFKVQLQNIDSSGTTSTNAMRMFSLPFTLDVTNVAFSMLFDNITLQGSRTGVTGFSSHTINIPTIYCSICSITTNYTLCPKVKIITSMT